MGSGAAGDERLYAVALVGADAARPADQRRGLIWLVGMDANVGNPDVGERECFAAMLARRGQRVVGSG